MSIDITDTTSATQIAPAAVGLGSLLDVAPASTGPGRFRVTVDEAWTVVKVHGGVLAALAARFAEVCRPDPALRVTSVHATYLRAVDAGLVTGTVTWLRAGRSAAQATVDLCGPDGELAVQVSVVLAVPCPSETAEVIATRPIEPLDVTASTWALGPVAPEALQLPFHRQHAWMRAVPVSERDGARTFASWFALHDTPRNGDGEIEPLVSLLAADAIGLAATESLGLWDSDRTLVLPTLAMDVQIFGSPTTPWLLQHAEIHHLADGLVFGTVKLFDEADRLVACSSQRAAVRFF